MSHQHADIQSLAEWTPGQLRKMWSELGLKGEPPKFKHGLVRDLSWHMQRRSRGGMDADTRRLLKAAIRNAPDATSTRCKITKPKRREKIQLRTGTTLVRIWHNRKHKVTVLNDGKRFRFKETEYASLSEIAREITGARWSGPRFFGLNKVKGVA